MPSATRLMLESDARSPWRRRPRASFRVGYRPALDGLRGVAVAAIIGFNLGIPGFSGGHVGIDVFFVLSGFLITSLLVEEWERQGRIDLTSFYLRRALRVLPVLLLVVAVCVFGGLVFSGTTDAQSIVRGAAASLAYLANWSLASGKDLGPFGHTWTLAIQEQFYLLWPPVLVFLLKRTESRNRIAVILLGACLAVAAARYAIYSHFGWAHAYYDLESRGDALLMGCFVACLAAGGMLPRRGRKLVALRLAGLAGLGVLLAVPLARNNDYHLLYLGLYTVIEFAAATFIASIVATPKGPVQSLLSLQPLVWLGRIALPLYLWHYPVAEVIGGANTTTESWAAVVGVSLVLAVLTHYVIERPLEAVRAHLRRVPGQRTSSTQTFVLAPPAPRPLPEVPEPPRLAGSRPWIHEPFQVPEPPTAGIIPAGPRPNTPTRIEAYQG